MEIKIMFKVIDNKIKSRLDDALKSSEPEAKLIKLVGKTKKRRWNQLRVYDVFETYMFWLEEQKRQVEADIVTEVVSYIYGWCTENLKLFPHTLSNDEIKNYRESKKQ